MPLLLIDPERAAEASTTCRELAATADDVGDQVLHAAVLAELNVGAPALLMAMADTLQSVAGGLGQAAVRTATFRLPTITPGPDLRWNQVRQIASHNSYQSPDGLPGLYDKGVRAFELDLHLGAPTSRSIWQSPWELLTDAIRHDDATPGDWRIYHHSFDPASSYGDLSQALTDLAAIDTTEPITVFLDLKDPLIGSHTAPVLDALLRHHLGGRLFTPADVLARDPESTTLQQSLDTHGWPTGPELEGRVIVVLTDEVDEYRIADTAPAAAFVALAPTVDAVTDPNVVFYNVHVNDISELQVTALQANGGIVRTWGGPMGAGPSSNYLALDL